MYIKTIEVENKGKSIKLGYIQDIRKAKTLRESSLFGIVFPLNSDV